MFTVKSDFKFPGGGLPLLGRHLKALKNIPFFGFLEIPGLMKNSFHMFHASFLK
jgi:hypothetical protein